MLIYDLADVLLDYSFRIIIVTLSGNDESARATNDMFAIVIIERLGFIQNGESVDCKAALTALSCPLGDVGKTLFVPSPETSRKRDIGG